jgi:hypothetical protein
MQRLSGRLLTTFCVAVECLWWVGAAMVKSSASYNLRSGGREQGDSTAPRLTFMLKIRLRYPYVEAQTDVFPKDSA